MIYSRPAIAASSAASTHSSMHSAREQLGNRVRNLGYGHKTTLDISLDDGHGTRGGWVTSYSTMDTIEGTVSITAAHDTRFENIEITLLGTTHVFVDRLTSAPSISGRTEATHRFLTLKQPINDAQLPCPRVLAGGRTYVFPFAFTIPAQLLPRACSHTVTNDTVRSSHLMLPPSMGDPDVSGFGGTLLDDFAPEMSKVIYLIRARVLQVREPEGSLSVLVERSRKVRVKPAFEEQPPVALNPTDTAYRLRHEKVIKKGLFKGKLGTLSVQSAQPKALVIPGARSIGGHLISTTARVALRFDPADEDTLPPRLGSMASKIKISTYYASTPRHEFPLRCSLGYDQTQGLYQETISLSTLCVASAQWQKHTAGSNSVTDDDAIRRDSGISDCSAASSLTGIMKPSSAYRRGTFYTTQITVPITLPNNKNFLPTFHSCLISRIYTLHLDISVQTPGIGHPTLHLKVPVQICAEGSEAGKENARARTAEALLALETDDMFVPRSVAPPSAHEDRDDLPPEYAALNPMGSSQARILPVV